MDLLKEASKNINLYEIKSYVRKAQNVALNLSEMETKVREATNNEPWGASTRLMAQIAAGTYNYREREEILSFIFRRFTEKAANEWRQIYKSLQLLEYIIRNGSERVIDDIRSNISLIQMLKSFHYIDSKGRDQGINVRNRSKNLVNLLNDDSLIRSERKKSARQNQKNFGGISGGGASITAGSQYGGNDDDFNNRVYGDGGVFGARYDDPASAYDNGASGGDNNFEEYNVEGTASSTRASKPTTGSSKVNAGSSSSSKPKAQPEQPAQDLLGDLMSFDASPSVPQGSSSQQAHQAADEDDDDDFDDFQSAPSASNANGLANNIASLYVTHPSTQQYGQQPHVAQPAGQPNFSTNTSTGPSKPSGDAFSSLFSSAKTKTTSMPKTSAPKPQAVQKDDDFFNDFTSNNEPTKSEPKPASSSNNGEVDLLSF